MPKPRIVTLLLILGILLIFTGLALVGIWFPTSEGGACRLILWNIACFHSIGASPGASLLFAVISDYAGDIIVALGVLLIATALVIMLHSRS